MKTAQELWEAISYIRRSPAAQKKQFIVANSGSSNFRLFFKLALSPEYTYGTKALPVPADREPERCKELTMWLYDIQRVGRAEVSKAKKAVLMRSVATSAKHNKYMMSLITLILQRKPDCGIGTTFINTVWPGTVRKQIYMGAKAEDKKLIEKMISNDGFVMVFTKYEGAHVIFEGHYNNRNLWTRQGEMVPMQPGFDQHLRVLLQEDYHKCYLVGEGVVTGDGEKSGYLKDAQGSPLFLKGDECPGFRYIIWDLCMEHPEVNEPRSMIDRYMYLKDKYTKYLLVCNSAGMEPRITLATWRPLFSYEQCRHFADLLIANGEEGAIAKAPSNRFRVGKVVDVIKLKYAQEGDVQITGVFQHKTKPWLLGGLYCKFPADRIGMGGDIKFKCGSGMTDLLREKDHDYFIGKEIEVTFTDVTYNKQTDKMAVKNPRITSGIKPVRQPGEPIHTVSVVFDRYTAKTGNKHKLDRR